MKYDPFDEGSKIFLKVFEEFKDKNLSEVTEARNLFKKLIECTEGWVIVDFLDSGNWDCLKSVEIDEEEGYLFMHWDDYPSTTFDVYKPTTTSLLIHYQDIYLNYEENLPFACIRGYAIKEHEILKYFKKKELDARHIKEDKQNFCSIYKIDREKFFEECYCYNTPIYSILIIPKDVAGSANDSQKILFTYNFLTCRNNIVAPFNSLLKDELDEHEICAKANTIRRIFEMVLKIECCFLGENAYKFKVEDYSFDFKKEYSDQTLGDLIKIIRPAKDEREIQMLNKIRDLSNELSHDSGKKVTKMKGIELARLAFDYVEKLQKKIV